MSLAMYNAWQHAGSPWSVTSPLVQFIDKMEAALSGVTIYTLGDQSHMVAVPAEDHTPYSETGWPNPNQYPVVHACDVMNAPGVDCQALFDYWLSEAKAGRMPWLKYLIWQAKLYSVRSTPAWKAQPNSDHFDHVHLSARTDTEHYQLGSWSPVPGQSKKGKKMRGYKADGEATIYLGDGMTSRTNFSWAQFCYMVDLGLIEPVPAGQPTAGTGYDSWVWVLIPGQVENYAGVLLSDSGAPVPGVTIGDVDARIAASKIVPPTS